MCFYLLFLQERIFLFIFPVFSPWSSLSASWSFSSSTFKFDLKSLSLSFPPPAPISFSMSFSLPRVLSLYLSTSLYGTNDSVLYLSPPPSPYSNTKIYCSLCRSLSPITTLPLEFAYFSVFILFFGKIGGELFFLFFFCASSIHKLNFSWCFLLFLLRADIVCFVQSIINFLQVGTCSISLSFHLI